MAETEPRTTRVLIVDDHQLTRAGLVAILGREPDVVVVGEAGSGREAIDLARALEPDLVLMDIRMPDMDGLDATRRVKELNPRISVLLLSMFEDPDLLVDAVDAGAAGYVLKDSLIDDLLHAVREVLSGGFPLDDRLARLTLERLARQKTPTSALPNPLSMSEREVLGLLAQGATNREIADALMIAPYTVKVHVDHICAKLGVSDRIQAAVRAIELGLVPPA